MDSKMLLGEVYLFKDEWKISLSCALCGMESERLEHFLRHSFEHRFPITMLRHPESASRLLSQLNDHEAMPERTDTQEQTDNPDTDPLDGPVDTDATLNVSLAVERVADENANVSGEATTTAHDKVPRFIKIDEGFRCSLCNKILDNTNHCKLHRKSHLNERSYKCHICGAAFLEQQNMKVHVKRHLAIKAFACPKCDKSFVTNTEMRCHFACVHAERRRMQCPHCEKSFHYPTKLKRHLAMAHSNERSGKSSATTKESLAEGKLECPKCGKKFRRKTALRAHEKLHDKNES